MKSVFAFVWWEAGREEPSNRRTPTVEDRTSLIVARRHGLEYRI
jgi:hypothetical protein